uniref:Cytochrome P450 94B3 n=1 Tax=Tanacetum cinerariifolium TaxID=118510 RepID=A0A6L2N342_TANCI|nr:cytochrome P450 94B3 [Tanacetum cinerariifolium]
MTTLAEHMIVADAENHPPMLDKIMYNSWQSRMFLYIKGKKNGRMMLECIMNELLVYSTIEKDGKFLTRNMHNLLNKKSFKMTVMFKQLTLFFKVSYQMCIPLSTIVRRLKIFRIESSYSCKELNFHIKNVRLAFDTICKISLGWDPCFLDFTRSTVSPLAAAFDVAAEATAVRDKAAVKWVWKVKKLLNVESERKLKEAVGVIHFAVNDIIRKRRENMDGSETQRDLLSRFISAGHDDELVRDMVISFLMAGRDTTSAAMTWLFWLLTWHPTIEKDLLNEITSMIKEYDHLSLTFDDLKEMDYLKACLCESMRLYPPVVWDSKHAAENDVLPDGTPVYKGNRVMYFPYGMGRMEKLWGKDCLEFRPDRWFSESGVFKMENPYKFSVFQAGPRVCLGKEMAFMQMRYVVASVLRRFELVPVSLDQPVFVPLLTAHMDGGLKVRVRKRSEGLLL